LERQLTSYPDSRRRLLYLGITVLATVTLYYELYVQGAVATQIIRDFGFTFTQFVLAIVIGNAVGAFASLGAGLADRWGRANLVVGGLLLSGLLTAFAMPNASTKAQYTVFFALVSMVEGAVLVATPALVRDFSPQVGRGMAMAFWTMGPVLGSLVVTQVSSRTLPVHPDWRYQFQICGAVGLTVFVIALVGLRELAPRLRDQLMVSMRDRALIEARAAGIDTARLLTHHWRQMVRLDIVGPALAISVFLLIYYMLVAFEVVYFATVFGYTEARADDLANWYWIANVVALVVAGALSDRLLVRKPFMIVGAAISLVGIGLFAHAATDPATGYHTFAAYFGVIASGIGLAYVAWMAAFTETVEKHNPAATATGLAIWGWTVRVVVTITFAILPAVVPATTTLADKGARVAALRDRYPQQAKVVDTVDPATLAALRTNPDDTSTRVKALTQLSGVPTTYVRRLVAPTRAGDLASAAHTFPQGKSAKVARAQDQLRSLSRMAPADLAFLQTNGAEVAQALMDNPRQWETWWWICFAAQLAFIPFVFLMTGGWSPRRAREAKREHERLVEHELSRLQGHPAASP
jgi:MFS family permease